MTAAERKAVRQLFDGLADMTAGRRTGIESQLGLLGRISRGETIGADELSTMRVANEDSLTAVSKFEAIVGQLRASLLPIRRG